MIALGCEDCNDADTLRHDPILKVACDRLADDAERLSSKPTLSRFDSAGTMKAIKKLLLGLETPYVASLSTRRKPVVLDIDTTADETHGRQPLTFFHGFSDHDMDHPQIACEQDGNLITAFSSRPR